MHEAIKDLIWFIIIVIIIFVVWFFMSGNAQTIRNLASQGQSASQIIAETANQSQPGKAASTFAPQTPTIQGTSQSSGSPFNISHLTASKETNPSPYLGQVSLQEGAIGGGNVNDEYLTIQNASQNTKSVDISGWHIVSTTSGNQVTVGLGVSLAMPGQSFPAGDINGSEDIVLKPGGTAYIISGYSPISQSFLINKCTGYFNQSNTFYPSLPYNCPSISKEPVPSSLNALGDACHDYVNSYPQCTSAPTTFPQSVAQDYNCQLFVTKEANYNQCVTSHRSDADFLTSQWYVYLNHTQTIWKSRYESIELRDLDNKVVDRISY
jgi:hypothetical protein